MPLSFDEFVGELANVPDLPGARCRGRWELFDATSTGHDPAPREYAQRAAVKLCAACPVLEPCRAWLDSLPPSQRPSGVVAGLVNGKEPQMTNETAIPTPSHRDIERALRGAFARMRGDNDILPMLAAECETPTDVDMCIVAAFDALAKMLLLKVKDPVSYLTQWIALEQQLAEQEETGDDTD